MKKPSTIPLIKSRSSRDRSNLAASDTKGDDIKLASDAISFPSVYVYTSDYEGGLESGFALTTQALMKQMIEPCDQVNQTKALLLPHVSMQPIEVEKIKELLEEFGYETYALPDISTSLEYDY